MGQSKAEESSSGTGRTETLRAQLSIEPHHEASCTIVDQAGESATVTHRLKTPESSLSRAKSDEKHQPGSCSECHTEVHDERGVRYLTSSVSEQCICPVFEEYDCIPRINTVKNGSIIAVVTIRSRDILRNLIQDLETTGATVSIEWLVRADEPESTIEIDVSDITTKQSQALETALEAGYYDEPRRASLEDLAEELSVSESAVSQRLNAAETKLVKSFFEK